MFFSLFAAFDFRLARYNAPLPERSIVLTRAAGAGYLGIAKKTKKKKNSDKSRINRLDAVKAIFVVMIGYVKLLYKQREAWI